MGMHAASRTTVRDTYSKFKKTMQDVRKPLEPVATLMGHTYAVRRVKCSPHDENVIASVS